MMSKGEIQHAYQKQGEVSYLSKAEGVCKGTIIACPYDDTQIYFKGTNDKGKTIFKKVKPEEISLAKETAPDRKPE
jgi:hypothetical protein